jgi:hypothetical protein
MSTEEGRAKRAAEWKPGDAEYGGGFAAKCSTEGCDAQARWPHGYCATHRDEEYAAEPDDSETGRGESVWFGAMEFRTGRGGSDHG